MIFKHFLNKKAIIFDWDGTLFDSMEQKRKNLLMIFMGLGAPEGEVLRLHVKFSGVPRKELFKKMFYILFRKRLSDKAYLALSKRYTALNIQSSAKAKVFRDVKDVIVKLHKKYLLFVSSASDPDELSAIIKKQPMRNLFAGVYASKNNFCKGKWHFGYIKSKWSFAPSDLLYVGDGLKDLELARAAGIEFIRIVRDKTINNGIGCPQISSFGELLNYLV